ncbi:universal stress protein [bacterium]|jgi:nucleotide-binding universal stress UspA family protein|nr:universal stress protein [bacterium]
MLKEKTKVIWAVDAAARDKGTLRSAAKGIFAWAKAGNFDIEPIHVYVSPGADYIAGPIPDLIEGLRKEGQKDLDSVLKQIKIPGVRPLKVVTEDSFAIRDGAKHLVNYAKKVGAEMIVVSSHGRKGLKRWLIGSFAETLSLYSDVPLYIVHPHWKKDPTVKKILFPTDFSDASGKAFHKLLNFASLQNAKVTLFNKVGGMAFPAFDLGLPAYYATYANVIKEELADNQEKAKHWIALGKSRGVQVNVLFDRSHKVSVVEAILKASEKMGGMIAMVSQTGNLYSILLGSTTRQVIRQSKQPVWIIHPNEKRETKHQSRETVSELVLI